MGGAVFVRMVAAWSEAPKFPVSLYTQGISRSCNCSPLPTPHVVAAAALSTPCLPSAIGQNFDSKQWAELVTEE